MKCTYIIFMVILCCITFLSCSESNTTNNPTNSSNTLTVDGNNSTNLQVNCTSISGTYTVSVADLSSVNGIISIGFTSVPGFRTHDIIADTIYATYTVPGTSEAFVSMGGAIIVQNASGKNRFSFNNLKFYTLSDTTRKKMISMDVVCN